MSKSEFFRLGRLKRNLLRKHRPCPKCKKPRVVCLTCTKVVCEECGHACLSQVGSVRTVPAGGAQTSGAVPSVQRPRLRARRRVPAPGSIIPTGCDRVWPILQRLGGTGIAVSVDDPDAFSVVISAKGRSLADILKHLWNDAEFQSLATRENISAGDTKWPTEAHCLFKLR